MTILPLLVAHKGGTPLLSSHTLGLLERLAESTRGDLAVLVKTVGGKRMSMNVTTRNGGGSLRECCAPGTHGECGKAVAGVRDDEEEREGR